MFGSCELRSDQENFGPYSLKWSRWWFLHNDKDGIIATDRVPNGITVTAAYYQKFIQYRVPNLKTSVKKKLTAVCQYCKIMRTHMLHNQLSIYSLITYGKHFTIHLIGRVCRTSTFSKIERTTLQNSFCNFG